MPILYESEEDQKRAHALHHKQRRHLFGIEFSAIFAGFSLGNVILGFYNKNETQKNLGWTATVASLLSVIYNYHKSSALDRELSKPENANVIMRGTPISPFESSIREKAEAIGLLDPPIKGELLPADAVIVQGRKAWEEKMAEENAKCGCKTLK